MSTGPGPTHPGPSGPSQPPAPGRDMPPAFYCATERATNPKRHIVGDGGARTRCGQWIGGGFREVYTGDDGYPRTPGRRSVVDLPQCRRCEASYLSLIGETGPLDVTPVIDRLHARALNDYERLTDFDRRTAAIRRDADGSVIMPTPGGGHLPIGGDYPVPTIGQLVRDAERYLAKADHVLTRQYDPVSAGEHVADVDGILGVTMAYVRTALSQLAQIADLDLPAAGSAVMFDAAAAAEYGTHHDHPGQGTVSNHEQALVTASPRTAPGRTRPPGSECSDPLPGQGADHPRTTSEGRTPGLAAAVAATDGKRPGGPPPPGAGASFPPDPRRHANRAARAMIRRSDGCES